MAGFEVMADGGLAPLHVLLAEAAGPRVYREVVTGVLLPGYNTQLTACSGGYLHRYPISRPTCDRDLKKIIPAIGHQASN